MLEELLAYLLQSSGYDLLVDATQDPAALVMAGNGLCIRGRGAHHQVDVLGQLRIRIPFMYRLRLFVEAKYWSDPVGLREVRNALGVLNDVNEHYSRAAVPDPSYIRYHYRYALFSASGFTVDAQQYAITQQISLIDLSASAFSWLLRAADRITHALLDLAAEAGVAQFPVSQMREALRRAFGTWTLAEPGRSEHYAHAQTRARGTTARAVLPAEELARIAAEAADIDGALYLGFTDVPFVIVLQPDDPPATSEFFRSTHSDRIPVRVAFGGQSSAQGEWILIDSDRQATLRMALPREFESLVLGQEPEVSNLPTQKTRERSITIAFAEAEAHLVFPSLAGADDATGVTDDGAEIRNYARAARLAPDLGFRSEEEEEGGSVGEWSEVAVHELLRKLRSEGWPHADIIEFASNHGGIITREQVYRLAGYEENRMLRGFTRPTRRITLDLIVAGLLPEDVRWPLLTRYASGVLATHFTVPPEFTSILGD